MHPDPNDTTPSVSTPLKAIPDAPQVVQEKKSSRWVKCLTWVGGPMALILSWIGGSYSSHLDSYSGTMSEVQKLVSEKQEVWATKLALDERSFPLSNEFLSELRSSLLATSVTVASFGSNDARLDKIASQYRISLEEAAGAVSRFDGSEARLIIMLNSLQVAANIGGEYEVEFDDLNGSFYRKLVASLRGEGISSNS